MLVLSRSLDCWWEPSPLLRRNSRRTFHFMRRGEGSERSSPNISLILRNQCEHVSHVLLCCVKQQSGGCPTPECSPKSPAKPKQARPKTEFIAEKSLQAAEKKKVVYLLSNPLKIETKSPLLVHSTLKKSHRKLIMNISTTI